MRSDGESTREGTEVRGVDGPKGVWGWNGRKKTGVLNHGDPFGQESRAGVGAAIRAMRLVNAGGAKGCRAMETRRKAKWTINWP